MTKTIVIAGATGGMGRSLALDRLRRGDTVLAVGSGPGDHLRTAALGIPHGEERLRFLRADLSSIAENRRVIEHVTVHHPVIDALVLTANRPHLRRRETPDGLEYTFALYYLSRYLLGHGLREALEASPAPVILNVAGAGNTAGSISWDDPQLERRYSMLRAQLQAGRANDLLGVSFAAQAGDRIRYVLYHPGFTDSGSLAALPQPLRTLLTVYARFAARSLDQVIPPMSDLLDHPPPAPLTAIDRGTPVPLTLRTFTPATAHRLTTLTEKLLTTQK
ncbi:hypothetical protein Misp01_39580 [Microtetraspora sp. NBRC 13810]|uniref:SDR family NAD(P)-dependent oxidoreductase n=1 Tax=Microtetraspora sp. NBRC 13810 TaxID=3030990 RepID=UPI002554C5EA|nr:SDR family NAD(P)-dependent oxidoreductase [Microtetraspora sp. NBRC 13810]GLW08828.1 hypothetical protein Misp01_39580 [Microtetraspora sp. NBRC 13810]